MVFDKFAKGILILQLLLSFLLPFVQLQPISYLLTALLLLVNFICAFFFFSEEQRPIFRIFGVVVLMFCLLTIVNWLRFPKYYTGIDGLYSTSHEMTGTVMNLTTFFLVFRLKKRGLLSGKYLHGLAIILLALATVAFFMDYFTFEYSRTGNSVNASYSLIYLIFLLGLSGFSVRNTIIFAIIFVLVFLSAKRGAMISVAVVAICYLHYRWRNKKARVFLIPVAIAALAALTLYIYSNNENLQLKMEGTQEGNFSGRDYINETLILNFMNQDIEQKIFGYAFAGSVLILEMDAHNDYLEILTSQGILGLSFYILFLLYMIIIFFRARSYLAPYERFILLSGILMWYVRAYVSQTVYSNDAIIFMIAFAFILGGLPKQAVAPKSRRKLKGANSFSTDL